MRATICSLVIGNRSGRAVLMAATAAADPPLDATISMSASSRSSPQASRSASRLTTAVFCASSSNGNCATPTSLKVRGVDTARPGSQPARTVSSLPSGRPIASLIGSLMTMPGGVASESRSWPETIVHGWRVPGSIPVRPAGTTRPPDSTISPLAVRIGITWATSGSRATAAAASVASFMRTPPGSGESVAVTRTSNPTLSSRSRNETTSPRDSSSMSNSSAPTAAIPMMPSAVRPGWRTRLRAAKTRALIGVSAPALLPEAATTTRQRSRQPPEERPRQSTAAPRPG